jgi:hypothetical protein
MFLNVKERANETECACFDSGASDFDPVAQDFCTHFNDAPSHILAVFLQSKLL